jgi:hypothetical protein
VRHELLLYNPLLIANNKQIIVVNFRQDFVASTYNNFFQGQTDRFPFYLPNTIKEIQLSKQQAEDIISLFFIGSIYTQVLLAYCEIVL